MTDERGFTLIELLITMGIIGLLGGIALTQFALYKADAEYTKALSTLHDMQTSFEAAEQEELIEAAGSAASTYSGTSTINTALSGDLEDLFPGIEPSPEVVINASWFPRACEAGSTATLEQYFKATSCRANKFISYARFCNGLEIKLKNVAGTC